MTTLTPAMIVVLNALDRGPLTAADAGEALYGAGLLRTHGKSNQCLPGVSVLRALVARGLAARDFCGENGRPRLYRRTGTPR